MANYHSIIFDLGKVVFDLSFDRVFQSWATASGRHLDNIKSNFKFDEIFEKFERNEISPKEFKATISQRLNIKLTDEEFDKGWCDLYLGPYDGIDNLLINLKQNYKIVALTNTNSIHENVWRVKYANILTHFEKIFCSHELGMRKPEENIYKIVLDYLQCKAEESIFLDSNSVQNAKKVVEEIALTVNKAVADKLIGLFRFMCCWDWLVQTICHGFSTTD